MRASRDVPLITYQRSLNLTPLALARGRLAAPPGFAAIVAKAWALVAREQPMLRTLVVDFPFPHLYELPRSVAMIAIAREVGGEAIIVSSDKDLMQLVGDGVSMYDPMKGGPHRP